MSEGSYDSLWEVAWDQAARSGPGFRSRYELLGDLLAQHAVTGRLLEVGAGRGHFLQRVHERFPWVKLSAHEAAPGAAEHLRSLAFVAAVHEGDLTGLEHDGFHSIVCSEVLEHIDDDVGAIDAMTALLRPGGRLYLTVPLRPELWTRVDDAVGHRRRYEHGALARMCRAAGLQIDSDRAIGFPLYNAYYRLLGRKTPQESASKLGNPLARLASSAVAALFVLEARVDTRWGGRGVVVARKPLPEESRGR